MTQTADFPSREPAYQILREGARLCLELRPRTLRSRAALLYERIYESLMPLKKVKEHPRCRVALDTADTPCAEHAGARHREPDFTPHASHFRVHLAHARAAHFAPARVGGVRMCTDLGLSPPTFAGRFRMVNRRTTWGTGFTVIRGHGRAIWQREHSAPPRLPIDDSLVPRLKVKERHRCRNAQDTAITVYAEHAGARHQEPDFTPDACRFGVHLAHARLLRVAHARCGVRRCADLRLSPPTFAGRLRMVNRRTTWGTGFPDIQGQGRAFWQREHSAPPRLPIDDSLVPRLKVKERHRRRIAQDTAITAYAEHAGARHQEPDFTPDACRFRLHLAHARCVVRRCADLVCRANWHKSGVGSPPVRRPDRATLLREPCAGPRERAGEASVAVRMGRAIEQRNHIRSGCHCFQSG